MLHSGRAMIMGDREKGEVAASESVFPESPKASCEVHIKKNMLHNQIRTRPENQDIWRRVARAATLLEMDEWWEMLEKCEPKQAAYLREIPRVTWQNSEQIARGIQPHFTSTNNVVEGVGHTLLKQELGEIPIRQVFSLIRD